MEQKHYLKAAFEQAFEGMRSNRGGPFGAVVVLGGEIIGMGCNEVISTADPTAHAEIVAIRQACETIRHFHLHGAVLYATCEPCPMCMSAVYWAGIGQVFYCSDRADAARAGFNDELIYKELTLPVNERSVGFSRLASDRGAELFEEWGRKSDRISY